MNLNGGGPVPTITLNRFPYQYFSSAKPKLIEREKVFILSIVGEHRRG